MRRLFALSILALNGAMAQGTGGRPPLPGTAALDTSAEGRAVALFQRVSAAENVFLAQWYKAWRATEALRTPTQSLREQTIDPRQPDISCNPDPLTYVGDFAWGANYKRRRIASANGTLGVCPNWLQPGFHIGDERLGIDAALDPKSRDAIRNIRRDLIALMDTAVTALPRHNTLVGQYIRLLVDQGEMTRAQQAVRDCKADGWWCSALTGYVLARLGDALGAGDAFAFAASGLVEADRCKWADVRVLLDSASRQAYSAMSCATREDFNLRFWWLSDPLWSVPGNDRFAEHFSRAVTTYLHGATIRDERYIWSSPYGGDALEETIRRYGWPTYTHYGAGMRPRGTTPAKGRADMSNRGAGAMGPLGVSVGTDPTRDVSIDGMFDRFAAEMDSCVGAGVTRMCMPGTEWFRAEFTPGGVAAGSIVMDKVRPLPPIGSPEALTTGSTFEYSVDRVHTVPSAHAFSDPFSAAVLDWTLSAPSDSGAKLDWWPREHYAPAHPIVQFEEMQSAVLRRAQHPMLAFATNLGRASLGRNLNDSVNAALLVSSDPDTILQLSAVRTNATGRVVFVEPIPPRPLVASIEIPWDASGRAAGRSRFGVPGVQTLAQMRPGEFAISDPVLMLAPADGRALPNDEDALATWMLGGTVLASGTRAVGVYWETYGFGARDTVDVTLRIQRQATPSLVERLTTTLQVSGDFNVPITTSWAEPSPSHEARTIAGAIPIQTRSLIVDISTLRAGAYTLEVSVGRPGTTPVRSLRTFSIR